MNRQQKEHVVESLRKNFTQSTASYLVGYRGLSVAQLQSLRNDLRQHGGTMRITKARLMGRAAQGVAGVQDMAPHFKDQVALVFSTQDASATAKALHSFSKKNEALSIVAGCFDKQVLDAKAVIKIASLPSKEVLLGMLLRTMQAPAQGIVSLLNMQLVRLLVVLKKAAEKKK